MKPKSIIILVGLALLIAAAIYAYSKFRQETEDVVNAKADVTTDVLTLVNAFEKDTAVAGKTYIDKIVEVTGNIKRIDTSGAVVMGDESSPSEVVAGFDRRHKQDIELLKVGSKAVIQGLCSGYSKAGGDDLLSSLGTTIELKMAGVKNK